MASAQIEEIAVRRSKIVLENQGDGWVHYYKPVRGEASKM